MGPSEEDKAAERAEEQAIRDRAAACKAWEDQVFAALAPLPGYVHASEAAAAQAQYDAVMPPILAAKPAHCDGDFAISVTGPLVSPDPTYAPPAPQESTPADADTYVYVDGDDDDDFNVPGWLCPTRFC